MSRNDFERCTPSEFYEIYDHWADKHNASKRAQWEQTRAVVFASLKPYMKADKTPHDIMPFPWDSEQGEKREELSKEELEARFEAARKRFGLK